MTQTLLPTSLVDKAYIFKKFYRSDWNYDIGLLHLSQPIGLQIGWTGMAFSSDTGYFRNKVFHKFSYPAATMPWDTIKHYNGDSLYYNYGYIDCGGSGYPLYINSSDARGISGQSGSALFYTDNIEYDSFGVLSFSSGYLHCQITKDIFYQFKNIMDNYSTSTQEILNDVNTIRIYPNPFTTQTTLYTENILHSATLTLDNYLGQTVTQIENISGRTITINRNNLPSGLYFVRLTEENKTIAVNKLVITDK